MTVTLISAPPRTPFFYIIEYSRGEPGGRDLVPQCDQRFLARFLFRIEARDFALAQNVHMIDSGKSRVGVVVIWAIPCRKHLHVPLARERLGAGGSVGGIGKFDPGENELFRDDPAFRHHLGHREGNRHGELPLVLVLLVVHRHGDQPRVRPRFEPFLGKHTPPERPPHIITILLQDGATGNPRDIRAPPPSLLVGDDAAHERVEDHIVHRPVHANDGGHGRGVADIQGELGRIPARLATGIALIPPGRIPARPWGRCRGICVAGTGTDAG